MYRQIEELTEENELLKAKNKILCEENRAMRAENKKLHERIELLEQTMEERIVKAVEKATAPLLEKIAEKDKEILRLKAQLNKDSTNSSQPTSRNGFKKPLNNREESNKKRGGQKGHKGTRLNIPKNLEELVAEDMAEHIIISEVSDGEDYVSDWTVDISIKTVYTEYRRAPGSPPKIEYGTRLKAIAVYLSIIGLIAFKRLSEFFQVITNQLIMVSKASLAGFIHTAAEAVELEQNVHDLLNGAVIGVDETPIKTSERPNIEGVLETSKKTTFNAYIRTYSNETTTILTANPFKTEESVIADNILTQFHGIVSQDHEAKFYNFGKENATCGAHLTRELRGLSVLQMLSWAEDVRQFFLEMNNQKNKDVHSEKNACEPILLCEFEARYDELLRLGKLQLEAMPQKSFGYDELRRMVNRLDKHKDNYMIFIRNYDAPFTNNQAERDLRHCKTRQKVSGCFRSWQGVLDYCKLRSVISTSTKRGLNPLEVLSELFLEPTPSTN